MPVAAPRQRFTDLNGVPLSLHLGSFTGEIRNWGLIEPEWWRNYLHVHSFFEVCFAFQGRGTFRILDRDYTVQSGDVFVAKPGESHEIISSEDEPLGIYFWAYTLIPASDPDHHADGGGIDRLLHAFVTSRRPVSSQVGTLAVTLSLLTEEIAGRAGGYVPVIEGLTTKLLIDVARAVTEIDNAGPDVPGPDPRRHTGALVGHIVQYLHDNYSRPLVVRDVAAQVHLSERHTNRLFHQAMGVTLMEYLTGLRLENAAQLLVEGHLSIKEVARSCGYPDVRYFTTVFRKHTGLTPAAFRRRGGTRFL